MSNVLAIIPARSGSKGIPNKNFTPLADGLTPAQRAIVVAEAADVRTIVVTSDMPGLVGCSAKQKANGQELRHITRPPALAQDDTPMIDVVKHVLAQIPGPPDQPIVLLQPTQPLREPKHITQALELLTPEVDSVVSVTRWPQEYSPELMCHITPENELLGIEIGEEGSGCYSLSRQPTRRQDAFAGWKRDGTFYAFWRKTVSRADGIYGRKVRPLIIPPEESQALDTPADWIEAERRLKERAG